MSDGLAPGDAVVVVTFPDIAPRDQIAQSPRHRDRPAGTFALRSPARRNLPGLVVTRITSIDEATGRVGVGATDTNDGTRRVDLKHWIEAVDIPPGPAGGLASTGHSG